MRRFLFGSLLAVALMIGMIPIGVGGGSTQPATNGPVHLDSMSTSAASAALSAVPSRRVTKLLVFVEENHSLSQMKSGMPYAFGLAKRYGYATDYVAIRHPSLPNYVAIAGGSTYGIQDDSGPSAHRLGGRSVFGQAVRAGKTAKVYVDGMPSRCALDSGGNGYAVRHNPWTYFVRERSMCRANDLPLPRLRTAISNGALPNVGMVIPNVCHDAHDCSLRVADAWFKAWMTRILNGPDWRSGHLAVVMTADEDDHNQGNKVLTVVIHPSQSHRVVRTRLTHYSLTRLYDDVIRRARLHNAGSAPSMSRAFHLPLG